MEKQFVTYEIALKLNKLGFNEECLGYFRNNTKSFHLGEDTRVQKDSVLAPLWQQVVDWFREKHNIHISIPNYYDGWRIDIRGFKQNINIEYHSKPGVCLKDYEETREQSILKAIDYLIKIL